LQKFQVFVFLEFCGGKGEDMQCSLELRELAYRFANGGLSTQDMDIIVEHLTECSVCAEIAILHSIDAGSFGDHGYLLALLAGD